MSSTRFTSLKFNFEKVHILTSLLLIMSKNFTGFFSLSSKRPRSSVPPCRLNIFSFYQNFFFCLAFVFLKAAAKVLFVFYPASFFEKFFDFFFEPLFFFLLFKNLPIFSKITLSPRCFFCP